MKYSYLFVIALLGQGCLLKKVAVSHADLAIEAQIQKRLHLESDQRKQLSMDVDQLIMKAKPKIKELMPLFLNLKLEENVIETEYLQLLNTYLVLAQDYTRLMAKYMVGMDEKQQKKFWETFDERTNKIKKRNETERLGSLKERFQMFFGGYSLPQEKILEDHSKYLSDKIPAQLETRKTLKAELTEVFAGKGGAEVKSQAIEKLYENYHGNLLDHKKNLEFLKMIIPTLSKKQHQVFEEKAREIHELTEYFLTKNF